MRFQCSLFTTFVFVSRLNPLRLVRLLIPVAKSVEKPEEALDFIGQVEDKVKADPEASVLAKTIKAKQILERKPDAAQEIQVRRKTCFVIWRPP